MNAFLNKLSLLFLVILLISFHVTDAFADSPTGDKRDPFYIEGAKYEQNFLADTPSEYISLYTGDLNISQTDLYLPGNNGLDLKIQRTYTSRLWQLGGSRIPYGMAEMSCLGFGWSMHMGRIEDVTGDGNTNRLPVVVMADGSRHPLYKDKNDPNRLISKELWIFDKVDPSKWELTLTNGTKYTFEYYANGSDLPGYHPMTYNGSGWVPDLFRDIAQVTEIRDIHNNIITIKYHRIDQSSYFLNIPKISLIIDSCLRQINFEYYGASFGSFNQGLLKSITYNGKSYSYFYSNKNNKMYENLLTKVTPPEGNSWLYEYFDTYNTANYGWIGNDLLLQSMTYPTGAKISYTYERRS